MATKIISTTITAGYSLGPQYSLLQITSAGEIEGYGLKLNNPATVQNDGQIISTSSNGVSAQAAATIVNGALGARYARISGYSGVFTTNAACVVTNYATIRGNGQFGDGVFLTAGGTLTNGAAPDTAAYISGDFSGVAASTAQVMNFGTIKGFSNDGVYLASGGAVTNGSATDFRARISGQSGVVVAAGAATIVNDRTIVGYGTAGYAVRIASGQVTNGAADDTTASLYGVYDGVGAQALATLANFGTVGAQKHDAVTLHAGGQVTNGSAADTRARIAGATGGIEASSGVTTIANYGTIASTASGGGVLFSGGRVTNGSTSATSALIEGFNFGVAAVTANATVLNFGVIDALGGSVSAGIGVSLKAGGTITNGSAADTTALIEAEGFGVYSSGLVQIANFGTIDAFNGAYLSGGASLTNGSAKDTSALIFAYSAVVIRDGVGTVANFGSIIATGTRTAVALFNQGAVTNGSSKDVGALIEGGGLGVLIDGQAGTVNNFGTIKADLPGNGGVGVYLNGGILTNGSASDTAATISGRYGVEIGAGAPTTVTNFGTLYGFGGVALYFLDAGNRLNVEAGCAFVGQVLGGGGLLDLASGVGTLSSITSTGNVTVTGSMAKTTFQNFAETDIGAGAVFTDKGAANIGAGHTLSAAGTLTLAGAVKNAGVLAVAGGTLTVQGAVTLAGVVSVAGGLADFAGAFKQDVTFAAGGGVLELGRSQAYSGTVTGFAAATSTLDLDDIAFGGATTATYKGTAAAGTLTVVDGTHTAKIALVGDYRHATFIVAADGHGGTLVTETGAAATASAAAPPRHAGPAAPAPFISAMAALGPKTGDGEGPHAETAWRTGATRLAAPRVATA